MTALNDMTGENEYEGKAKKGKKRREKEKGKRNASNRNLFSRRTPINFIASSCFPNLHKNILETNNKISEPQLYLSRTTSVVIDKTLKPFKENPETQEYKFTGSK